MNQRGDKTKLKHLLIIVPALLILKCSCQESSPIILPDYVDSYDIDYPLYEPVVLNFTLFKCHCDIHHLWDGSRCIEHKQNLSENLFVLNPNFYGVANISNLFKVRSQECSTSLLHLKQDSEPKDHLFISDYGELYYEEADLFFSPSEYCIEFRTNGSTVSLEATACLPPLDIPHCCHDDNSCFNDVYLVATAGNHRIDIKNHDFAKRPPLTCQSEREITSGDLRNSESLELHYKSGVTDLKVDPGKYYTEPELLQDGDYCIYESNKVPMARYCYLDPLIQHQRKCNNTVCVRKCCQQNQIFDLSSNTCSDNEVSSSLFDQIVFYEESTKEATGTPENITMEYGFPWCPKGNYLIDPESNPKDKFLLLESGFLYVSLSKVAVPPQHYCIENFVGETASTKVISCFLDAKEVKEENCKTVLYPVLLVISCIFLSITLVVYACIPELHAKLHGKSLISHVSSLLAAFMCQLIVSWGSKSLSMVGCKLIGLANQVTFLWAFFWLNVMCFDIWWTLKTMSPRPRTGENTRRRFVYYSIYAWGSPVIICLITALLEFVPSAVDAERLILPGFGVRGCWFQDTQSVWVYFHGFTLFLYVTNILFFFHVAAILIKEQKSTEGILRPTWKQHRERVWLYLKLFVVMGLTWICEVASWQEGTCEYWIFTDIVNSMQGVFIFFIFMCNRKVFQKIQSKGLPAFQSMKAWIQETSPKRIVSTGSSSSRRTTGTSVESSSRRLSTSLQPALNALNLETIRENKESPNHTTS